MSRSVSGQLSSTAPRLIGLRSIGRLFALLLLAPAAVFAQSELPAPRAPVEGVALPIFDLGDAGFEGFLVFDPPQGPVRESTLDRIISRPSQPLGSSVEVPASVPTLRNDLALLCRDSLGLSVTLATLGEHCLLATLGETDSLIDGRVASARLGTRMTFDSAPALELQAGLAFLDGADLEFAPALSGAGSTLPGLDLDVTSLGISGLYRFSQGSWLSLGTDFGLERIRAPWLGDTIESRVQSLSLGMGHGDFSGRLIGRVVGRADLPGKRRSLDLGLSWQTPWDGDLTIGARNLLRAGELPPADGLLMPGELDGKDPVPYVRYHQDL